jgi:hypothetical protein
LGWLEPLWNVLGGISGDMTAAAAATGGMADQVARLNKEVAGLDVKKLSISDNIRGAEERTKARREAQLQQEEFERRAQAGSQGRQVMPGGIFPRDQSAVERAMGHDDRIRNWQREQVRLFQLRDQMQMQDAADVAARANDLNARLNQDRFGGSAGTFSPDVAMNLSRLSGDERIDQDQLDVQRDMLGELKAIKRKRAVFA